MTSVKVSLFAGVRARRCRSCSTSCGFLAPAMEEHTQRVVSLFVPLATRALRRRRRVRLLRRPAERRSLPDELRRDLFNIQIRASYYFSFVSLALLAMRLVFELPIFILALVRIGVLTRRAAAPNRRIGYRSMLVFAVLLPDGRPGLARARGAAAADPLRALDPARSHRWSAAGSVADERGRASRALRVLSADWVLPVEGEPIESGAVAIEDGRIVAVGPADGARRGERFDGRGDRPGLRQRAHAPRVRGLRRLRRRARVRAVDRAPLERKARIDWRGRWRRSRGSAPPSACAPGSPPSATRASPARPRSRAPSSGCGRSSTSRSSGATRARRCARSRRSASTCGRRFPSACGSAISPHAPYTCSTERLRGVRSSSACRSATHLAESPARSSGSSAARARGGARASMLVEPPGQTGIRSLARAGLLASASSPRTASRSTTRRSPCSREHGVARRALPALERPARLRHRAAGRAPRGRLRVGIGTDSVSSRPFARLLRGAADRDPARASTRGRRPARSRPRRRSSWRRSAAPRARPRRGGRLARPGQARRPCVVSLSGSPYLPWEDPAAAVVFGGAPERVSLTLVDGEVTVPREEDSMARADRRRVAARGRMLQPPHRAESGYAAIEDTMFFPRLRKQAKWVFVFLALVFGVGFVVFGVGADGSGASSATSSAAAAAPERSISVSTRARRSQENPRAPTHGASSRPPSSRTAARTRRSPRSSEYVALRPKDDDALRELAGLYLSARATLASRCAGRAGRARATSAGSHLPAAARPSAAGRRRRRTRSTRASRPGERAVNDRVHERRRRPTSRRSQPTSSSRARPRTRTSSSSSPRPRTGGRLATAIAGVRAVPEARARTIRAHASSSSDRAAEGRQQPTRRLDSRAAGTSRAQSSQTGGTHELRHQDRAAGDDSYVISLAGEVDLYTAPEFKQQLLEVIGQGGKQ